MATDNENNSSSVSRDPWKVSLTDSGSRTYTYQPQAYIDALEKYKNDPEILARLKAVVRQFQYNSSPIDGLLSFFGADPIRRLQGEYALNADNAISEIINNAVTRDYNSEAAQASRMRAAGMNPDLSGIGDAASQNMTPPDETLPDVGAVYNGAFDVFKGVSDTILQVPQMAISLADSFSNLQLRQQDILGKKLSNWFSSLGSLDDLADAFTPQVDKSSVQMVNENGQDISLSYGLSDSLLSSMPEDVSRYLRMMFKRGYLGRWQKGDPIRQTASVWENFKRSEKNRSRAVQRAAQRSGDAWIFADNVSHDEWQDDLSAFVDAYGKNWQKYNDDIMETERLLRSFDLDLSCLEADYDWDKWKELNGKTAAEAENAQNAAAKAAKDYEKSEDDFWNGILSQIPDNWFGKLLKLGTMFLRANASQGFRPLAISHGRSQRSGQRDKQWNPIQGVEHGENQGTSSWFSIR